MEYEQSKYNAEFEAFRIAARGLPLVIVLPTAPLGARDIKPNPAGQLILDFLARRLPGYLDGGANFIDVDDLARGHVLACKRGRAGERYILGGENLRIRDLFLALERITGVRAPKLKVPYRGALALSHLLKFASDRITGRPPLITPPVIKLSSKYYYVDTRKAEKELGFRPVTPLVRSAAKAVRWFAEQGYLEGSPKSQNDVRERIASALAAA
jgi:dihydroflavonol-4-reductase